MTSSAPRYANRILAALPPDEMKLLGPHLERTALQPREVLQEPGELAEYLVFPESGMVSMVLPLSDGRTVEVAAVGREGLCGYTLFMGTQASPVQVIGQVAGQIVRIQRGSLLELLPACPQLTFEGRRFAALMLTVTSQNVACGQMHQLTERLARWLLTVKDLTGAPRFALTQEFMAEMLGTNRPTVTLSALTLANAGLIRYSRGRIEILDQQALEDSACECYHTLRAEYDRLGYRD